MGYVRRLCLHTSRDIVTACLAFDSLHQIASLQITRCATAAACIAWRGALVHRVADGRSLIRSVCGVPLVPLVPMHNIIDGVCLPCKNTTLLLAVRRWRWKLRPLAVRGPFHSQSLLVKIDSRVVDFLR